MRVGGQRSCCSAGINVAGSNALNGRLPASGKFPCKGVNDVSIPLNSARRLDGPAIWTQPPLEPAVTRLISSDASSAFSASQSEPLKGSKASPKPLRRPYENIL